jgi:hypothetical protein
MVYLSNTFKSRNICIGILGLHGTVSVDCGLVGDDYTSEEYIISLLS